MVLDINLPLSLLACVAVSLLIAGTLRSIKHNIVHRPAQQSRLFVAAWLDYVEAFFWAAATVLLIVALPHPSTIVIVALLVVSLLFARRHRYSEEIGALNRWIPTAVENGASLAPFLDEMSNGYRSRLARRTKACVIYLLRGAPFVVAIRHAKLPVGAETIAAISGSDSALQSRQDEIVTHEGNRNGMSDASESVLPGDSIRERSVRESESQLGSSYALQQFAYVVATILLAWLIGRLVREYTIPAIEEVTEEFSPDRKGRYEWLLTVGALGNLVVILLAVWLLMLPVVRWLPSLARFVPWFGRGAIDRWRCEVLEVLGGGMRSGRSEKQILETMGSTTRVRWIRKRCHAVDRFIEQGMQLSAAMRRGKLITKREFNWLTCAEANGNLPESTERLSAEIRRRDANRWKIRMAWFVPAATVLVGGFVLAHAVVLFGCFVAVVDGAT